MTFYDDATGERVELSVATFANWVAKTANLLQDDLAAEPGDRLALLLPAHWQTAVWLLACSSVGVVADVRRRSGRAPTSSSAVRTRWRRRAPAPGSGSRSRCARWAARFPQPPAGLRRLRGGGARPGRPVRAVRAGGPGRARAASCRRPELTGARAGRAGPRGRGRRSGSSPGSRLLSGLPYDTWDGLSAGLYAPLAAGGSVVLCRHLDRLDEDALAQAERERARHPHGLSPERRPAASARRRPLITRLISGDRALSASRATLRTDLGSSAV